MKVVSLAKTHKENGSRLVSITLGGISAIGRTTDVALWIPFVYLFIY